MSVTSKKDLVNGKYIDDQMANGVPAGGTSGQVLKKNSNSDYDLVWGSGGGGGGGGGTVEQIDTAGLISGGPINVNGTISTSMNTNKLVGRYSTGTGIMQEIALGDGLSISGGTLSISGVSSGQALTKSNDTNVTLSLGGTPSTALLQPVSLTLGWTGQLSTSRGGTGLGYLGTENQLLRVNSLGTALEYFTPTFENTSNKNAANGYPGLDSNSEITSSQIKGVLQYTNFASFPTTGDQYKLYIDQSTRLHYYWNTSTSTYIKIGSFTSDFTVYLSQTNGRKTFMRWENGDLVPAANKHPKELLFLGAQEGIAPTVTISATPSSYPYYTTSITNTITVPTKTINPPGTSVASVLLEWKRSNEASTAWRSTGLSPEGNVNSNSYTHTDTNTNTNTNSYNYRYTVVDNVGASSQVTTNVTISAYSAPSISSFTTGSGTTREYGNISSAISFTINRNSVNIPLTSYDLQYSANGGAWTSLVNSSITGNPSSVPVSYTHNDSALVNSTSIAYKVIVTDTISTGGVTLSGATINFYIKRTFGYSPNATLTVTDILALNKYSSISNAMPLDITAVTAGADNYTYYCYSSSAGDINIIMLDQVETICNKIAGFCAFTKLADVTGTNSYGATVTYKVYKSNAPQAFTSNQLTIS